MRYQANIIFCHFLVFMVLSVTCAIGQKAEPTMNSRMPVHKTDGIFDIIALPDIATLVQKLMQIPFQLLKKAVIPILELPYHIVSTLWSWIGSGTILPGMTPMGSRSLSTGLFAGVISRILNIDLINSYFNALAIDEKCRERAACEMGAYVIHQNQYAAPILHDVFKNLFEQTTKYWTHMQRGMKGGVCHNYYRSCVREFFMKR